MASTCIESITLVRWAKHMEFSHTSLGLFDWWDVHNHTNEAIECKKPFFTLEFWIKKMTALVQKNNMISDYS